MPHIENDLPEATTEFEARSKDRTEQRVRAACWCIAILVTTLLTWSARFSLNPDGLSYVDVASNYLRGDWSAAVNTYWSPLYSWVIAFGLWILRPSSYWELPAIQLVNFTIFLVTMVSFDIFWRAQGKQYLNAASASSDPRAVAFPRWAWTALGYALFIWTLTNATVASEVTPDLLVAALIYAAAAALVRMRTANANISIFILFGFVLGVGFLAKAAMFVFAFVFLGAGILAIGNLRRASPRILASLVVFLLVAAPFIAVISSKKGHLTLGDSARINYAWGVNHSAPFFHWQGANPDAGVPTHPTRRLLSMPALYEFASPVPGTYPPHYDPSYWNDGLKPHFHLWQQLRALLTSAYAAYDLLFLPLSGLIAGILIVGSLSDSPSKLVKQIGENAHLVVPAAAGLGLYALVTIEPRYVAGFVLMLWAALLSAIRLPRSDQSKKVLASLTIVVVLTLSLSVVEKLAVRAYEWKERSVNSSWLVADGLSQLGIQQGDKVVTLGSAYNAYWAHLARLKIIAEIPTSEVENFWAAGPQIRSQVFATSTGIGAKAIVARGVPKGGSETGWHKVGQTSFYAYLLSSPALPPSVPK